MKKRILAILAALSLLLCLLPAGAFASGDRIEISNAGELISLADKCRLDSWSVGKTVVLTADIDLGGQEFEAIPSFGGVFDGAGHTVSGLKITKGGSAVGGLFRYVQDGATVRSLNVEGVIAPEMNAECFGGIAGENSGRIENCSYSGSVSGTSNIGGVVGINTAEGELYGCRSLAAVSGEHYTGGIAGENFGSIVNCTNLGPVNTTNPEVESETLDIDWEHLNSTENMSAHTDTGGVCGFSQGSLENCVNRGNVGYPHVGYNVGGIAGRQSGCVTSCRNFGEVNGRKDVGGIVGQLVPAINMQFSTSVLSELRAEMDTLQGMLNTMISDFEGSTNEVSDILTDAGSYLEAAGKSAGALGDALTAFVDGNISNINNFAATVAAYLGRLEYVAKYMENCFNSVSDAMEHLETAVEALEKTAGDFAEVLKDIGYAMDQLGKAQDMLSGAIGLCRSAINELSEYFEALGGRIENNIGDNADKLPDSRSSGSGSAGDTPSAGGDTPPAGGDTPPAGGDTPPEGGDTPPAGGDTPPAGGDTPPEGGDTPPEGGDTPPADDGPQLPDIGDIIPIPDQDEIDKIVGGIAGELEIFTEAMGAALGKLSSALGLLDSASGYLDDAIEKGIEPAVEKLTAMAENANAVTKPIEDALEDFDFAADALGDAAGETGSILGDLSHEDTEIIQGLGSGFMEETDRMEAALAGLSGQMEKLNTAMTGSANLMSEDLRNINDQFFKVMDCFMDLLEGNQNPGSVYKDVSEEQLFYTKEGKLEDCENRGNVDGDVNVGGIAGTMAIEYDLDPEEDISVSGGGSGTFRYFTNAVVLSCTNHNPVCSKKNASGGIVGYMDLGVVYSCENYGDVSSTSGDYAGGIAGQSAATVRNSMCLAAVSGRDYVGGIAGSVADISGCKAIVTVNSTGGWKGSIAGEVTGEAKENYFVGEKLGGIDGVSYAGKAEPMEYTEFTEAKGLSGEFEEFKLTFATDNMLVESLSFTYGGSIDPSEIPEVPKREGYVGEWEDYDFNNLTVSDTVYAVYTPYDTVVAAGESVGKRAVVLLEGAFLPGSTPGLEHCENAPEGSLEAWTVTAVGSVEESFTLRYLMPDEEAELYILRADGSWEKAAAESEGSYVLLDAEGESLSFAAVAAEKEFPVTALILTGAGGAVLVLLVLIMRARAGRGKHTVKK